MPIVLNIVSSNNRNIMPINKVKTKRTDTVVIIFLILFSTFREITLFGTIDNGDFERHINRVRRGLRKQNK